MTYERFEDLPVWNDAIALAEDIYKLTSEKPVRRRRSFCDQLERAALSVSNNIAEGFERVTTNELNAFLAIARGSAGEVRSMMAVVKSRPKLQRWARQLQGIRDLAESCARQLTAWTGSIEDSPVQGKRHLNARQRESKQTAQATQSFRQSFLRSLKPNHPLYNTTEARAARGEPEEE